MRTLNSLHCINGNGQRVIVNAKFIKSLYVEDIMQRRVFDEETGEVIDFQMAKHIAFEIDSSGANNAINVLKQNRVSFIELRFSDGLTDAYYTYWGPATLEEFNYKTNRNQHVEVMRNGNIKVYISNSRRFNSNRKDGVKEEQKGSKSDRLDQKR